MIFTRNLPRSRYETLVVCYSDWHIKRVRKAFYPDDIDNTYFVTNGAALLGRQFARAIVFDPPAYIVASGAALDAYMRYVDDNVRCKVGDNLSWV